MSIDWLAKLRVLLQTVAFCLAVSAILHAFQPNQAYEVAVVYSLCIGFSIWLLIDFGRHLFASSTETGWPSGALQLLLPLGGIVGGFVLGSLAGDWWFGWSSFSLQSRAQLPVSILVTALAGIAASYFFYTRTERSYLQTRMSEARRHASEAKLKLLQTQLEPHMLFNSLANLRVLIGSDPARAQAMLDHMIAYLRATLSASRSASHSLQTEFDRLRDYLELMVVRMGPRLHYELDLPDDLASHPIPTLLLQPLVENAIRHGLEPKLQGGSIRVRARRDGQWLELEVLDSGVGLPQSGTTADGFGLSQVRERLATAYENRATLALSGHGASDTRARITIPANA